MITSLLGSFGILSVIILFFVLSKLSQRFGAVIKMPPIYRNYYFALIFLAIGYLTNLSFVTGFTSVDNTPDWIFIGAYYLPVTIGVTWGLAITWRYWHWLVTELSNP